MAERQYIFPLEDEHNSMLEPTPCILKPASNENNPDERTPLVKEKKKKKKKKRHKPKLPTDKAQSPPPDPLAAIVFGCFWLVALVLMTFLCLWIFYQHHWYGFGYGIGKSYPKEEELCNYMRTWNRKMLGIILLGATVRLAHYCLQEPAKRVSFQEYFDKEDIPTRAETSGETRQEEFAEAATASLARAGLLWTTRLVGLAVALAFALLMIRACWVTNHHEDDAYMMSKYRCRKLYNFTQAYSTIMTVIFALFLALALVWIAADREHCKKENITTNSGSETQ